MRPPIVILAGGKGTRLGDLTKDIPKPMVEVCGKPFLHWLIERYVEQGFADNIVVSTGYQKEIITNYPWPWNLAFYPDLAEKSHLDFYDTAGMWVVNGDTWILRDLPDTSTPIVMNDHGIDAGAQFTGLGKARLVQTAFYDIGTPSGLERFREYFTTHLDKK